MRFPLAVLYLPQQIYNGMTWDWALTCQNASNDLMWKMSQNEDSRQTNCSQQQRVEDVWYGSQYLTAFKRVHVTDKNLCSKYVWYIRLFSITSEIWILLYSDWPARVRMKKRSQGWHQHPPDCSSDHGMAWGATWKMWNSELTTWKCWLRDIQ